MGANERLQRLQAALVKRGVRDVKFFLTWGTETSASELCSGVADVLEAVENGNVREINSFAEFATA